jgi:hypothetical protein
MIAIVIIGKKFLTHADNGRHLENLLAGGSQLGLHLNESFGNVCQITREVVWDLAVDASEHFAVEASHVICSERGL